MDKKKTVTICLILAAFFLYLVASQFAGLIFDSLNIAVNRDFGLTIPEFIGVGVAVAAFLIVINYAAAMEFFVDVVNEMTKVVYPTPKESGQSAVVVIIMVGMATVLLAVFDTAWSFLTWL